MTKITLLNLRKSETLQSMLLSTLVIPIEGCWGWKQGEMDLNSITYHSGKKKKMKQLQMDCRFKCEIQNSEAFRR